MTKLNQIKTFFVFFSAILVLLSVVSLVTRGLNLGLDFKGGIEMELEFTEVLELEDIEKALSLEDASVINYGHEREFLVRLASNNLLDKDALENYVKKNFKENNIEVIIKKIDAVGAEFSHQMLEQSLVALLIALISMTLYIAFRFELRLALSALIALVHDPIMIFGFFSFSWVSFDLTTLTAILAIIGYSLNDTIVVFDRIRENFEKHKSSDPEQIVNMSIKQTLSRTIVTSLLTLFVTLSLGIFGPEVLVSFSLALSIGIIVGTYSSIFISSTVALSLGLSYEMLYPPDQEGQV